jgi:hypothetical protein
MTVAHCQRNWYTAAETHHHSHSAEASSVQRTSRWVCSECAGTSTTAWMLSDLPGLSGYALNLLMI